jgi:hypothetical protein
VNNLSKSILKTFLATMAVVALLCQPARAQFGMGGGMDPTQFMAPISKKAIESYAQMLGMDKDQKDAAMALQEGYRSSFKQLQTETQKFYKEMTEKAQESGDFMAMAKEAAKAGQQLQEKGEKLESGFLEDIKALLTDVQKDKWPRVERARRRDKTLRFGFYSGQNMDLVRLLQGVGVKPDSSPELAGQVDRYELEMDKDLKAFEAWGKEQQENQGKMFEGGFDMSKIQDMMKKMGELSKAMRDTNVTFARSISMVLPPEKQAQFDLEVRKKSYPRVYRESYTSKALAEAEKFNDLDSDQKASIAALKSDYARDLEAANKAWAAAITDKEDKNGGSLGMIMMMGQGDSNDEVGRAHQVRKDLDTRVKDRLLGTLTESQKSRLPEDKVDPKDNNPMAGFMNFDPPEQDE